MICAGCKGKLAPPYVYVAALGLLCLACFRESSRARS